MHRAVRADGATTSFEEPGGLIPEGNSATATATPTQLPAGEDSGHGWQDYSGWPPPGTHEETQSLTLGDQVATAAGAAGTRSYTTYPTDEGYTGIVDSGTVSSSAQKLVFGTSPLKQDMVIAGSIVVHLRAALSSTDGNLIPMYWRFATGHELRILVYGGESTELMPEATPVTTTVSLGRGGSTLTLPVLVAPHHAKARHKSKTRKRRRHARARRRSSKR